LTIRLINENGLCYFVFPNLMSFPLKHAIFSRLGGYSKGPYYSLNVSYNVGDRVGCVEKNLKKIKAFLGADSLVFSEQVHGSKVLVIKEKWQLGRDYIGFDSLVTNLPKVALLIKLADCQGIFLYDSCNGVIANIHCGWRGSVANIIGVTIKTMIREFGSSPSDIWAAISPSLGPCCSEFKNYKKELPKSFWSYQIRPNYFDFWKISISQLMGAGIPYHQILLAGICNACLPSLFFSYRRNRRTGRFATAIMLEKSEGRLANRK